ncbi:MAG TPA: hypothetical protein VF665_22675 [Longimicrobium sp.]|jgi:hypothetical protein|uniref:hypothetical protein n=1 Tax=Longimicrobium sp. TaxID=2029185 RepID=UPI002EDAF4A6
MTETLDRSHAVLLARGEEIGELRYTGGDMFWHTGVFTPLPAFAKHHPIFARLEAAWAASYDHLSPDEADAAEDARYALQAEVDALLTIRNHDGTLSGVEDFKLMGGQFEHKLRSA